MLKKINNKILFIVFAILAIFVVLIIVHEYKNGDRTFKSDLFTVDSSKVTSVTIYPKAKVNNAVKLIKNGKNWEIKCNDKTYPADTIVIQGILKTLAHLKAERVAGSDKSSWKNFEISDTASTHVLVEQGKDITADFKLGKVSFTRGNQMYSNQNNVNVKTHIKVAGDDRVYVVDGFLTMMFSDQPSQYRNRVVLHLNEEQLTKLTFSYPSDSSFILAKTGNKWIVNDQPADSVAVEKYINSIANTVSSEFADEGIHPPVNTYNLKIEGSNMPIIEVKGAIDSETKEYFVSSTFNPANFASSNSNLFDRIFANKNKFDIASVRPKIIAKAKK